MKKIIVMLICLMMVVGGVGCSKDIPEGVSEEFYDDMVSELKIYMDCLESKNFDYEITDKKLEKRLKYYIDNKSELTDKELEIYNASLSFGATVYAYTKNLDDKIFRDEVMIAGKEIISLLNLDIKIEDINF